VKCRISLAKEVVLSLTLAETYPQFLDDLAHKSRLRPNTLRAYRYELAAATQDSRFQIPLPALELNIIEDWIGRDRPAAGTRSRRAATFNRFFKWTLQQGLCERNPLDGRMPTRSDRRLPRPIQRQTDQDALEDAIRSAPQPYRLIFTILRETGMRVGEVLDLRVGDVLLETGREGLRVREPKNRTERTVVLGATATPKTIRGLRAHSKQMNKPQLHDVLFRSNRGTAISYDAVHYQWQKLCQAAALIDDDKPRYTLHQLRHTRGSELLAQGQPIEIVQRVLGHRDIRSTLLYAELNEDEVRAALERPPS
jgi:integrase/recombinase XerD